MIRNLRTAALVAAMVLTAACGGGSGTTPDEAGPVAYGEGVDVALETTTTTAAPAPSAAPPTTAGSRPKRGTATTAAPAPAQEAQPSPTTAVTTTPPASSSNLGKGAVGSFARHLLRPAPAKKIVLEFLQQPGKELSDRARTHVTQVLSDVAKKPVETPVVALPAGGDDRHSEDEVRKMADQYGQAQQGGDQAVIRLLVLRGRAEESPNILGFAIRGDVLAIFPDQLRNAETAVVDFETLEDAVTMHEVGHILGLVDLARKTGREDKAHPGHSSNRGSVMFWAVESSLVGQVLGGPPPTNFDNEDIADLVALREGA